MCGSSGSKYLDKGSCCIFSFIQDKFGAIPEGQSITEEDETPHESSKESHHYPFSNSPTLCKHKIFLIPVKRKHLSLFQKQQLQLKLECLKQITMQWFSSMIIKSPKHRAALGKKTKQSKTYNFCLVI